MAYISIHANTCNEESRVVSGGATLREPSPINLGKGPIQPRGCIDFRVDDDNITIHGNLDTLAKIADMVVEQVADLYRQQQEKIDAQVAEPEASIEGLAGNCYKCGSPATVHNPAFIDRAICNECV